MQLLKYYGLLQQYGFGESNNFPYPKAKLNYCCAEYLNSFVAAPPVYMGGCPYNDMVQGVGNACDRERYNLKDTMLRYYDAASGRLLA